MFQITLFHLTIKDLFTEHQERPFDYSIDETKVKEMPQYNTPNRTQYPIRIYSESYKFPNTFFLFSGKQDFFCVVILDISGFDGSL